MTFRQKCDSGRLSRLTNEQLHELYSSIIKCIHESIGDLRIVRALSISLANILVYMDGGLNHAIIQDNLFHELPTHVVFMVLAAIPCLLCRLCSSTNSTLSSMEKSINGQQTYHQALRQLHPQTHQRKYELEMTRSRSRSGRKNALREYESPSPMNLGYADRSCPFGQENEYAVFVLKKAEHAFAKDTTPQQCTAICDCITAWCMCSTSSNIKPESVTPLLPYLWFMLFSSSPEVIVYASDTLSVFLEHIRISEHPPSVEFLTSSVYKTAISTRKHIKYLAETAAEGPVFCGDVEPAEAALLRFASVWTSVMSLVFPSLFLLPEDESINCIYALCDLLSHSQLAVAEVALSAFSSIPEIDVFVNKKLQSSIKLILSAICMR